LAEKNPFVDPKDQRTAFDDQTMNLHEIWQAPRRNDAH